MEKIFKLWQNSHLSLAISGHQSSPLCQQSLADPNYLWVSRLKGVMSVLIDNCSLLAPLGNLHFKSLELLANMRFE